MIPETKVLVVVVKVGTVTWTPRNEVNTETDVVVVAVTLNDVLVWVVLVVVRLILVLVMLSVLRVVDVMIRVSFEVLVDLMTDVTVL